MEAGGREARPAQAVDGRSVGDRARMVDGSLVTRVSWRLTLAERGAQAADGRVNAGSKQNDRQHKGADGSN